MHHSRHRKGNANNPENIIKQAMEKMGWEPRYFFIAAKHFAQNAKLDIDEAVKEFHQILQGAAQGIVFALSAPVISFANWVLVTDNVVVHCRFAHI